VSPSSTLVVAESVAAEDLVERRFLATETTGVERAAGDVVEVVLTSDGRLRARISCNELSGGYVVRDGRLLLDQVATTAMACPEEQTAQDRWLDNLLQSRPAFELDGMNLTMESQYGAVHMLDARAPHPGDAPLAGPSWRVAEVVDATGGGAVDLREAATIEITGDRLTLQVECRQAQWSVAVDEGAKTITLSPRTGHSSSPASSLAQSWRKGEAPTTTVAAAGTTTTTATSTPPAPPVRPTTTTNTICDPEIASEWQHAISAVLDGELHYQIDIDDLHLRLTDGRGLELTTADS
jgi:heat shock protein HslJ